MSIVLIVLFTMLAEAFSKQENWNEFNSSLCLEITRPHGIFTCSGVAISPTLILTAAHCLEGEIKNVRVFIQETYNPKHPFFEISKFKIHPEYNSKKSAYQNDLAKIITKNKLPSLIHIHSIHSGKSLNGTLLRFGFGERNKKNVRTVISPTLRGIDHTSKILELNDQFSTSGDSGGPVFIKEDQNIKLLAIHSTFSHGPEGNFSFNPLLTFYHSWIFEN